MRLSPRSHRELTAYHPETNGLTERLTRLSRHVTSVRPRRTHSMRPHSTLCGDRYKPVRKTNGFTPSRLVRGRKATEMLDVMLPYHPRYNEVGVAALVSQRHEETRQYAQSRKKQQQRTSRCQAMRYPRWRRPFQPYYTSVFLNAHLLRTER